MRKEDLINAVSSIVMEDEAQANMIEALKNQDTKRHGGMKAAGVILALIAAAGVSVPAYALVTSRLQERMENMTPETITSLEQQVQNADVDSDSFNRPYSATEQQRMEQLYTEYLEGYFPQNDLLLADSEEKASEYVQSGLLCFLPSTSTFYLPLYRELTDEEILELLDFMKKRDYALLAGEVMAREEEQRNLIQENVKSGGITEEEAIEIAQSRLQELGLNVTGFEMNHYYDDGKDMGVRYGGAAYYNVNWSNIFSHTYYYFWINAEDGTILDEHIGGNEDNIVITEQEAIEIATKRAAELGLQLDGFEMNHGFEDGTGRRDIYGGIPRYGVNWANFVSHTYYYFMVNAQDGSILDESYEGHRKYPEEKIRQNVENGGISAEEAKEITRARLEEQGIDTTGVGCDIWFTDNHSADFDGKSYYKITWIHDENRKFYGFYVDGRDGTILEGYGN
ncbi:MAG: PepSY domain-containing protein [Lachnospiraceae bacterium]|nr:PepSY domain-containing protein [Lachnospiraceae bacterium]